jgi:hypothetical protein
MVRAIAAGRKFPARMLQSQHQHDHCAEGRSMANEEHLAILKQGVKTWNHQIFTGDTVL